MEEDKVVYTGVWGGSGVTVCDADDKSTYCQSKKIMFYVRSVSFILVLLFLIYFAYKEYAPKFFRKSK
jgi:hypothetical protein